MLNITSDRSVRSYMTRSTRSTRDRPEARKLRKFPRAFKEALSERVESRRADTPRDTAFFFSNTRVVSNTSADGQSALFHLSRAGTCATFVIPIARGD